MAYDHLPVSPLQRPSKFNFATHVVDYWAKAAPENLALYWTDQSLETTEKLSYTHFSRQSHRIAQLLSNFGIKQGDTCILILPRLPVWWEIATACLRAGVVVCPCTTLLVDKDIEYRLQVSHATTFIGDAVAVSKVLKVRSKCPQLKTVFQINEKTSTKPQSDPSSDVIDFHSELNKVSADAEFSTPASLAATSPALIFFTSGTTGAPKMVQHSQISYPLAHALTGVHWLQLSPGKVYWNLSEQGWAKAAWSFFATFNNGACLFVHDDRQPFSPQRTITVLNRFPITTLCAPPTVYRQLVLEDSRKLFASPDGKPKALVHACGAGEPLNESVITTWKEMTNGMEIFDGYGQTETILVCANQKENKIRPGSMGRPIPGVPLYVIDNNGKETENDVEGDIAIEVDDKAKSKFFGICDGYVDKQSGKLDRRTKTFGNGRQFYLTGDRASRDKDGYFWFVGRSDDVINSSGYRIGPFEVESTLKSHPSVAESAVVSSPDPQREEVVKAFIVLTTSAFNSLKSDSSDQARDKLIKELQDHCKKNAAPYKYPRKIEFVDANFLPKTISGKIRRGELKKLERERYDKQKQKEKDGKAKL